MGFSELVRCKNFKINGVIYTIEVYLNGVKSVYFNGQFKKFMDYSDADIIKMLKSESNK